VKTLQFLTQFKRFIMMNQQVTIAKDRILRLAYFLLLIGGPEADAWVECQYSWLDQIKADPQLLPYQMNTWQALENNLVELFINYAIHEKAHEALRDLKMKSGNIDQFIADFQFLAHRTLVNVNDSMVLYLFKTGLPLRLAKECVKLERPRIFEQWAKATQAQQCNWIVIQGLKAHHAILNLLRSQPA
jgi:hypothetical protein